MLIFEKFRIEGARARARLQGTTDLPGSCDKMRGAEILSAAAGSASRSSAACDSRTRTRTRSENIQQEKGTGGRAQLRARASARKLRHSARQQNKTKFMNELSYECSVLSKEPFACDQQIGTNALSSSNAPFVCDQHIRTKFMNALFYQMDRLHAINKSGHMFCLRQINCLPAINTSGQNS